jgi:hypothetical protein
VKGGGRKREEGREKKEERRRKREEGREKREGSLRVKAQNPCQRAEGKK